MSLFPPAVMSVDDGLATFSVVTRRDQATPHQEYVESCHERDGYDVLKCSLRDKV